MSGRFASATAVAEVRDGVFRTAVAEGWDINGNANGGYLMAVTARAMARAAGRPDPVTITAHFLAPGQPGPAEVVVHVAKRGKRFATVSATLSSGASAGPSAGVPAGTRPLLAALGTFGDLSTPGGGPALVDGGPPELPPPEACVRRSDSRAPVKFADQLDLRLHPDDAGFDAGRPSGLALVRGWFRLHDGEPVDTLALLCAVDAFPPTAFNAHLPVAWTPTVELTAHVRARPAPGWLRCRFTTRFVTGGSVETGGFLEEDGEVWDSAGVLVAQSRQLALLPRA